MKKVITYGTFDCLHYGHINLLKRAKELGDYLIVGVTTESFDIDRGKMSVRQSLAERMAAVQETGLADLVIPEEYVGQKIDDIKKYDVDIFAIGSDWEGQFDYLKDFCEVRYLERTQGVSSTEIREQTKINIGVIGYTSMVDKFIEECQYINELEFKGIYLEENETENELEERYHVYTELEEFYSDIDAAYVVCRPSLRFSCSKDLLLHHKHVLCESPIALSKQEAATLFKLADEQNCILFEGIKTAYAIAFNRLLTLIQSNYIGEITSVESTCTSLKDDFQNEWGSFESWGSIGLLPILTILGVQYKKRDIIVLEDDHKKDLFTCINFIYPHAIASVKVGKGVKSEGQLIISGTKGYVYVPSPWWKTEYFELRYENANDNRRYYYKLEGEGIRYELSAFVNSVLHKRNNFYIDQSVTLEISKLMEDFLNEKEKKYLL